jgi:hypothetical protein
MRTSGDFSWIGRACAEAIRRYRECDFMRLPCDFSYGDGVHCIFCDKPKTQAASRLTNDVCRAKNERKQLWKH